MDIYEALAVSRRVRQRMFEESGLTIWGFDPMYFEWQAVEKTEHWRMIPGIASANLGRIWGLQIEALRAVCRCG